MTGEVNRPTWLVSLTDLLMVADILEDPAAFHHYARTRAGMHDASVLAAAEADALGAYLSDRLRIVHQSPDEEAARIFIGHSCDVLNDFYTRQQSGLDARKPSAEVPDEVASTLAATLQQPGWTECVDAVMAADSSVWKKWKRFRGKHSRGGTFGLNDQVSLVALADGGSSLERVVRRSDSASPLVAESICGPAIHAVARSNSAAPLLNWSCHSAAPTGGGAAATT